MTGGEEDIRDGSSGMRQDQTGFRRGTLSMEAGYKRLTRTSAYNLKSALSYLFPSLRNWSTSPFQFIVLYLAVCVFYALTICLNHAENTDGLQYAFVAETTPIMHITDSRAVFFEFVNKLTYITASALGFETRAFYPLVAISILVSSASVLLMARLLIVGFGVSRVAGWSGAGMLALSYSFWRDASAVEVYNGTVFLILVVANLLITASIRLKWRWACILAAALAAGIATLNYQPSLLIVFVAASILVLPAGRLKGFFLYGTVGGMVLLSGYVTAFFLENKEIPSVVSLFNFMTSRSGEIPSASLDLNTFMKTAYYIVHSFLSTNWIFSIEYLTDIMNKLSPRRDYMEIAVPVAAFKPWVYLSFATVTAMFCLFLIMTWKSVRPGRMPKIDWKMLFVLVSMIVYLPILIVFGRSFELWILMLPFFVIILSVYIFENNVKAGFSGLPVIFVIVAGAHNFLSGVGPLQSEENDYIRQKLAWVERNATKEDTVFIFHDHIYDVQYRNYLLYYGGVNVILVSHDTSLFVPSTAYDPQHWPLGDLIRKARLSGGRNFVLDDFFELDERIKNFANGAGAYDYYQDVSRTLSGSARLVHRSNEGAVYAVDVNEALASEIAELRSIQ